MNEVFVMKLCELSQAKHAGQAYNSNMSIVVMACLISDLSIIIENM